MDDVSLGREMQSCIATVQCDNARDWVLFYGAFNKSQLAFCEVLESLLSELYSQKTTNFYAIEEEKICREYALSKRAECFSGDGFPNAEVCRSFIQL